MSQVGCGIVGTGIMARKHAEAVAADPRARVAGWVSRSGSADGLDDQGAPVHRDVEALLADDAVEVVIVATPDFAHREAAVAAAEAGRHVLIEKPLATTLADAEAIVGAVTAAGVKAMTLFNHRWIPAYWQAKQILSEPDAGEPVMVYARKNDTLTVPTEMISWAAQSSPAHFLSSHDIDLVTWFLGLEVEEVFATAVRKVLRARGIDAPDAVQAQVRFAGGAVATFESCWTVPDGYPTVVESFIEVVTTQRHLHIDRKVEQIEVTGPSSFSFPRNLTGMDIAGRPTGSGPAAVQHFIDVVVDDAQPLIPLSHSVEVTRVLDAIERSYSSGAIVQIGRGREEAL